MNVQNKSSASTESRPARVPEHTGETVSAYGNVRFMVWDGNTRAAIKVQVFKSSVIISGRNTWKQRSTSSCLWRWTPTSNAENCESAPMRQIFRDEFMTISLACLLNVVVKTYQTQMQVMVLTTKSIHFTRTPLLSKGCVWYCSITPFIQPLRQCLHGMFNPL